MPFSPTKPIVQTHRKKVVAKRKYGLHTYMEYTLVHPIHRGNHRQNHRPIALEYSAC